MRPLSFHQGRIVRIFCAVRHSVDPTRYYGALWSRNFYPALCQLGHEVVESQTDLLPTSRFMHIPSHFTAEELEVRARTTQSILDEVKAAHSKEGVDLFLSYFYNAHFDPTGFDELRRRGIPSINFYCNSIYQFDLVKQIAAKVDFAWHAEHDARPRYLSVGANPIWVQMGADPSIYHPVACVRRQNACFVGQRYADRDRWVLALLRAKVPLVVYGPGWNNDGSAEAIKTGQVNYLGRTTPMAGTRSAIVAVAMKNWDEGGIVGGSLRTWRQFGYRRQSRRLAPHFKSISRGQIPFDQQSEIFSSSEIVLNFSNVWEDGRPGSKLIPHVRLRDFEAPMCQACYLTGESDEIHEFYDIGTEIDTYSEEAELIDKTKFYLANTGIAERMRKAGYQRALKDHTWRRRFEQLLGEANLKA
jgi:spore maturation protein CgeB